jgi:hypothetical protein
MYYYSLQIKMGFKKKKTSGKQNNELLIENGKVDPYPESDSNNDYSV